MNCEDVFLPDLKGSIVGYVYTFDEYARLLGDHSRVNVIAVGKQRSYQTQTDASGRFELMNLPVGTYELHFEKQGFATMKQFEIRHLGGKPTILGIERTSYGDECAAIFLYQLPTAEILGLSIENYTLTGTFAFTGPAPEKFGLRIYYSTDPGFAPVLAAASWTMEMEKTGATYQGNVFYHSFFKSHPGEEIFYKVCQLSRASNLRTGENVFIRFIDTYSDPETQATIYPNIGDVSAEYSFVLPE